MNTMTMANALKAVFGAQTLTTASYFPACAQDGTPSGVISAANLASVLGGIKPQGTLSNTSANALTKTGAWYSNSWSDAPKTEGCIVNILSHTYDSTKYNILQIFFDFSQTDKTAYYVRRHWYGDWRDWSEWTVNIPDFYKNYSDLSSLASALGEFISRPKQFYFGANSSVVVDDSFSITNRDSRILVIGYDAYCRRAGLVTISYDKTINWILKPDGWDGYFRIDVGDTNISVTKLGVQGYFYCGILNWWP